MFMAANFEYRRLYKLAPLLACCSRDGTADTGVLPGIGRETKGTWRWLYFPFQFQLSEIAKLA
jgi:cell division protein FtsW (lipid II flippase)